MIPAETLIVLDTGILVHLVRWGPVGQRIASEHNLLGRKERPFLSMVTAGEMEALTRKLQWGEARRQQAATWLLDCVLVPLTPGAMVSAYGEIDHYTECQHKPARRMGKNDIWIAATARVLGATLITCDADFDHLSPRFLSLVRVDQQTGATILET